MKTSPHRARLRRTIGIASAAIGLASFSLLGGCLNPLPFGSPPRQARLEILKPGVSTTAEVLLTLGEPRGDGIVRWHASVPPMRVWYYEYIEAGFGKLETKILLVYVDQDRYMGYIWFSSDSLLKNE